MTNTIEDRQHHFALYVQLFGGATAFSRRLGIDERAVRRFLNGERPISDGLLADIATALRTLIADAGEAVEQISATLAADAGKA